VIIDTETMESKVISNYSANSAHGAGIQAAQTIANANVKVVITGNIGPNAFNVLNASGIKIVTCASGSVRDAIQNYKNGQLDETERPTVGNHSNMKRD
jgi:predicted Fe-Mo cluster-binding NifX family protein